MTAHNLESELTPNDGACAVTDRAYSYSDALRAKLNKNFMRRGAAIPNGELSCDQMDVLRSGNALTQRLMRTLARSSFIQNGSSLKTSRTSASFSASTIQSPPSGRSDGISRTDPAISTLSFRRSR